jgi:DNA-binding transcriptional LysR family regulator
LLKKQQVTLLDVLAEPFLLQAPWGRPTFIERVFAERGINLKKPVIVGSREAVKAGVAAGYGVSLLPKTIIEVELKAGTLKTKKLRNFSVTYPMNIIYHRDKQLSPHALAFLGLLKEQGAKFQGARPRRQAALQLFR